MKKFILVGVLIAMSISGCSDDNDRTISPGSNVGSTASKAASDIVKKSAKPQPAATMSKSNSIGSGSPGAFCATSRLGENFIKNGITYECKGPKPYKWRRV